MNAQRLLIQLFRGYERYLANELKSDWILDKTPSVRIVQMVPDLNRFHANVRFIHCTRRHVDNVASKLKKFPEMTFTQACQTWARGNAAWLEVRDTLDGNYLEFDFHTLVTNPEEIATRIATYLELDDEEEAAIAAYLISQRPQAAPTRDLTKFLRLSQLDWSSEQVAEFNEICGPLGERLGYGTEEYFLRTEA